MDIKYIREWSLDQIQRGSVHNRLSLLYRWILTQEKKHGRISPAIVDEVVDYLVEQGEVRNLFRDDVENWQRGFMGERYLAPVH